MSIEHNPISQPFSWQISTPPLGQIGVNQSVDINNINQIQKKNINALKDFYSKQNELKKEDIHNYENLTSNIVTNLENLYFSKQEKRDQSAEKVKRGVALVLSAISSVVIIGIPFFILLRQKNAKFEKEMMELKIKIKQFRSEIGFVRKERNLRLLKELGFSEEKINTFLNTPADISSKIYSSSDHIPNKINQLLETLHEKKLKTREGEKTEFTKQEIETLQSLLDQNEKKVNAYNDAVFKPILKELKYLDATSNALLEIKKNMDYYGVADPISHLINQIDYMKVELENEKKEMNPLKREMNAKYLEGEIKKAKKDLDFYLKQITQTITKYHLNYSNACFFLALKQSFASIIDRNKSQANKEKMLTALQGSFNNAYKNHPFLKPQLLLAKLELLRKKSVDTHSLSFPSPPQINLTLEDVKNIAQYRDELQNTIEELEPSNENKKLRDALTNLLKDLNEAWPQSLEKEKWSDNLEKATDAVKHWMTKSGETWKNGHFNDSLSLAIRESSLAQFKNDIKRNYSFERKDFQAHIDDRVAIPSYLMTDSEEKISEASHAIQEIIKNEQDANWIPALQLATTQTTFNAAFTLPSSMVASYAQMINWEDGSFLRTKITSPQVIDLEIHRNEKTHEIESIEVKCKGNLDLSKQSLTEEQVLFKDAVSVTLSYKISLSKEGKPVVSNLNTNIETTVPSVY